MCDRWSRQNGTSEWCCYHHFLNTSQDDKQSGATFIKCEMCDFASSCKISINDHNEENNNWYQYKIKLKWTNFILMYMKRP